MTQPKAGNERHDSFEEKHHARRLESASPSRNAPSKNLRRAIGEASYSDAPEDDPVIVGKTQ